MDIIIEHFIDSIKSYLNIHQMTVTEFSRKIGCLERCIARWLDGTNTPSTEYVLKVADFMNCSVDFLFERTENPAYQPTKTPSCFSERLSALINNGNQNKNALAKIWKVEPSTISKWIQGQRIPKPDTVYKLADFYNCSMDYLLGRTDLS